MTSIHDVLFFMSVVSIILIIDGLISINSIKIFQMSNFLLIYSKFVANYFTSLFIMIKLHELFVLCLTISTLCKKTQFKIWKVFEKFDRKKLQLFKSNTISRNWVNSSGFFLFLQSWNKLSFKGFGGYSLQGAKLI